MEEENQDTIEYAVYQLTSELVYGVSDGELPFSAIEKRLTDFAHAILRSAGVTVTERNID